MGVERRTRKVDYACIIRAALHGETAQPGTIQPQLRLRRMFDLLHVPGETAHGGMIVQVYGSASCVGATGLEHKRAKARAIHGCAEDGQKGGPPWRVHRVGRVAIQRRGDNALFVYTLYLQQKYMSGALHLALALLCSVYGDAPNPRARARCPQPLSVSGGPADVWEFQSAQGGAGGDADV